MLGMKSSRFNKEGKFRTAQGTDDLSGHEGISLQMDPAYKGLSDYEEGDEVDITIKARIGAEGEDGKRQMEVLTCQVEAMPGEAKMYRNEKKSGMPPPAALDDEE